MYKPFHQFTNPAAGTKLLSDGSPAPAVHLSTTAGGVFKMVSMEGVTVDIAMGANTSKVVEMPFSEIGAVPASSSTVVILT